MLELVKGDHTNNRRERGHGRWVDVISKYAAHPRQASVFFFFPHHLQLKIRISTVSIHFRIRILLIIKFFYL